MNKIRYSLLFIFLFSFLISYGQNVEKTFRPGFFSTPSSMTSFGDNQILIGGNGRNNVIGNSDAILISLDTLGNVLWEYDFAQDFPSNEIISIHDIFIEDNNIIVLVQSSCCCDVVGGVGDIFKMDSTGEVIEHSTGFGSYSEFVKCGTEYGSIFYVFFKTWDSTFQEKGMTDFEELITHGVEYSDLICWESSYLTSVIKNDNYCGLIKITPTMVSQSYHLDSECVGYSNSNIQNIEKMQSGEIFIQNDNRIVRLDSSLNELDEMTFPDSAEIVDFKILDGTLIFIVDSLSSYSIKAFDKDFNLLHNVGFEEELKLIPTHAFIKNNKLFVAGEERSKHLLTDDEGWIENDSRSSIFYRVYNLTGTNEFPNHDIGLSQISVSELPISYDSYCNFYQLPECGPTENIEYKNVFVTISNYGNTPLDECTVNGRIKFCGNCNSICGRTQTYSMKYENLNLMPGESKEVLFGDILIRDQIQSDTHELCLWTANPNNLIDKNIENDQSCITSEVVVSIDQLEEEPFKVQVFPNPSRFGKVDLNIDSINEEKEIKIFDTNGKEVALFFLEKNIGDLEINTSLFPQGIYYLQVITDSFLVTKKIIIH